MWIILPNGVLLSRAIGLSDFDGFFLRSDDFNGGHEFVGNDRNTDEKVDQDQNVGESAGHFVASWQVVLDYDTTFLDYFIACYTPVNACCG